MQELGLATDELDEVDPVTVAPRPLTAPELLDAVAAEDARPELDIEGLPSRGRTRKDGSTTRHEEAS